ncbi:acyl carrier protein [Paenibacillus sp. P25]|nr:acyl carrier protein [Paenibacillus sp. P25]
MLLPLYYEAFRASELLQNRCVTKVLNSSVLHRNEPLYWTMEFFNGQGRKVAELKNLTGKLVREAGLIRPERISLHSPEDRVQVQTAKPDRAYSANRDGGVPPGDSTQWSLRRLMAEMLNRPAEDIDPLAGYYEMGLDSPGLLGMVRALESRIGVSLSPTLLFEYTTIAELASYLRENYASRARAGG